MGDRTFVMTGARSAGWAQAMAAEVAAALRHIGVDAGLLDIADVTEVLKALGGRVFRLVDINHKICLPVPVPKFSLMVDHPCARLRDFGSGHPQSEVLGWVDATHPEAASALGLPYRSIVVPHAGPDPAEKPLAMAERDIDIFFAGALNDPSTREEWKATRLGLPPLLIDLLFDTAERIEANLEPAIPAFLASCAGRGVDIAKAFSRDIFCETVTKALDIAETNRRVNVLTSLPEVRICVASDGGASLLKDQPNVTHLGFVQDFAEIRRLMGRAKIVLNVTAKFPRGSHERVWFGMAEGAVILTDRTSLLEQDFADGESIFYLPQRCVEPRDMGFLADLVRDPARLQAMADNARERYRAKHVWKKRVEPMWQALSSAA
jgi:hypothetical protein